MTPRYPPAPPLTSSSTDCVFPGFASTRASEPNEYTLQEQAYAVVALEDVIVAAPSLDVASPPPPPPMYTLTLSIPHPDYHHSRHFAFASNSLVVDVGQAVCTLRHFSEQEECSHPSTCITPPRAALHKPSCHTVIARKLSRVEMDRERKGRRLETVRMWLRKTSKEEEASPARTSPSPPGSIIPMSTLPPNPDRESTPLLVYRSTP